MICNAYKAANFWFDFLLYWIGCENGFAHKIDRHPLVTEASSRNVRAFWKLTMTETDGTKESRNYSTLHTNRFLVNSFHNDLSLL